MADDDFHKRYEQALEGLSAEQLEQVARLNPFKRMEWVDSPDKMRPILLRQWETEDREHREKIQKLKSKKRWFDII